MSEFEGSNFRDTNPIIEQEKDQSCFVESYGERGDIFSSSLWPGPQTIVRYWHIKADNDPLALGRQDPIPGGHKISLRHGPSGTWILILDGMCIKRGFEALLVRSFVIKFQLPGMHHVYTFIFKPNFLSPSLSISISHLHRQTTCHHDLHRHLLHQLRTHSHSQITFLLTILKNHPGTADSPRPISTRSFPQTSRHS